MIAKLAYLFEVITMYFYTHLMEKENVKCALCGSLEAFITHDDKYGGLRGYCPNCGANWPES